ncbi:hypothetical protein TPHA_0F03230 [Tetrapisispora phaffii CBS 4417]|uniref:Replication factor C subunit 1 n=1 Tax=Tetrapisispora phaffii (strain ATCC 24235 / CBS 4417 / NBRC 1672 / NRRL Y-8282 / UCD 70-5) TaxID=1071381 RepID=G8BUL8_TETPH|nr:hypothetical protein TPHA_0F03230 [Tetrapisispora phaffii CBS 4417]CCE63804.1 hypothetical protein TPHA_0F03230 [Tetrapisispora phaffii CBS 4417]
MVSITDFFVKGNAKGAARKKKNDDGGDTKKTTIDIIDLDDSDLDIAEVKSPVKRESIVIDTPPSVKKQIDKVIKKEEKPPSKVPVKNKSSNASVTAADVLATIPSVDLSEVHIKENVKFDFRAAAISGDSEVSTQGDFPEGQDNCLLGLTVVFTGVLPTMERGAAENIARRYGAKVTKSISGKTSFVVLGDEAGPKKVEKIRQLKVKAINEDGFRKLIAGMPADGGDGDAAEKARLKKQQEEARVLKEANEMAEEAEEKELKIKQARLSGDFVKREDLIREQDKLWTVKYAPTNTNQICGNKSSVNKLKNWLINWEASKASNFKSPGRDGSGIFRAAMLYGPPGIGKTTAAHLIAKDLGYDILEQNASDVRSKSLLNAGVKNALDNMSVVGYFKNKDDVNDVNGKKFVIVMDEVDGMSGGDRGGVGILAQFCRKTSTPLILICNERNQPKMRPFDRVCLDVQFRRPDANSLKARLMTIAVREKFKLDPNVIDKLVQATRGDIRQIINLLSTISKTSKNIDHTNISEISKSWEKNIALKPFDIVHQMLSGRIYSDLGANTFTLNDKIALYFDDFDFTPLMVQENYLSTRPSVLKPNESHLEAVAQAADAISLGDLVERNIRSSEQLWGLLPLHAVLSSVLPSSKVAGQFAGRVNFTGWLGQNSKRNKYYRLLQELQYHTRLSTSSNKISLRLEYMSTFKHRLLDPILKDGSDGIPSVISLMDDYYLTKEDWDYIMEFMVGPESTDLLLKKIPSTVKSGFTRKYNSTTHPVAIYRAGVSTTGSTTTVKPDFEDVVDADDSVPATDDTEDGKDDDLKKDKLIKQKKAPVKRKASSTATKKGAAKKKKA